MINAMAKKPTRVQIRMYRLGTGDCLAFRFYAGEETTFRMLVDAGSWSGSAQELNPPISHMLEFLENKVDVLVVTHEHKDHVHAFHACREQFINNLEVEEVWMAWTEDEQSRKVKEWKRKYGQQKKALGLAARKLTEITNSPAYRNEFEGCKNGMKALDARQRFSGVVSEFAQLHLSEDAMGVYKGGLDGMEVVKNEIQYKEIRYFNPGDIIENIRGLTGVKVYVLGPPKAYESVAKESGGKGESYDHNKVLEKTGAFSASILRLADNEGPGADASPFDESYTTNAQGAQGQLYKGEEWRKIDHDWLFSAGSFALRMNSLTNNLSLALAFEFEESGKVMLLPGDAEYGSWASWHKVKWPTLAADKKTHLTTDLLNRTVFYKVAHHLSHNGTAKKQGLELMTHPDLVAMATLDYSNISNGWKSTMPNRAILKELLDKTKGRLLITNTADLFFDFNEQEPLEEKIKEARRKMPAAQRKAFNEAVTTEDYFIEYNLDPC
jgi:hypothetical protein